MKNLVLPPLHPLCMFACMVLSLRSSFGFFHLSVPATLPGGQWSEGRPLYSPADPGPAAPSCSLPSTATPLVYQMLNFGYVTIKIKQLAIPA